jgi:glycine oxidase
VADVTVVGGGLIGLAGAWRLAQRGASVVVCDPAPLSGASYAAAGMLAPVTEVHYGEELLLALNLASAARYPGFVAELEDAAGQTVGHRTEGTLAVAFDAGDRAVLEELHAFQTKLHLDAELLDRRECRRLEPMLAPSVHGGLHVAGDHQVDNRRLGKALLAAATRAGVDVRREAVTALTRDGDKVTGVTLATGEQAATGTVVLAAGPWCNDLAGLPRDVPVRPVKGQILRLRTKAPFLTRTVRAVVQGSTVYVVPREDGEIVVGATMEEMGFDTEVRAGAVYDLLRDAHAVLPGIAELELVECRAGLRPGSPDNAPIVGPAAPGLLLATGHFRNGVLLTPITAEAIAAYVVDGTMPDELLPFGPDRFAR